MAFLNDLSRGLKVTGQTVAQKTKEIGETVQIKSQINTEKETITRLYAAIGKQIFESARCGFRSQLCCLLVCHLTSLSSSFLICYARMMAVSTL